MRILFITNIPSPYRIDFYNELSRYVDLTVIFEARRATGIQFNWNDDNIRFRAVFLTDGVIKEKKINFSFIKYLGTEDYDYIVATNYAYYTELFILMYLKIKRIPYFLEIDGAILKKESAFKSLVKKKLISPAKLYFSPSKYADDFLVYYGAQQKHIIRYSFTSLLSCDVMKELIDEKEKLELRDSLNISEDKVVLSVGQFIPRKGFDLLITAASNLPKDYGFYIVGNHPTKEYLELVSKYKLTNIHFVDFIDSMTLKKYYLASDLFVHPTREDVWGLVINEAMSCGLPVITTDKCIAGLELVKDNGIIIPTENVNSLVTSINRILSDDKLRKKMAMSSLDIIKHFTIEEMVKQHLDVFSNLQ